jgi:hypothetical protein
LKELVKTGRKVHWRVLLDLADLAKRQSLIKRARVIFKILSYIQPFAYQAWLEYAKMEEEVGNIQRALKLLQIGLKFCPFNDNIFIKYIKILEKISKYSQIRAILGGLKYIPIDRSWKMLMEGALFEGR